jgi:hypothetical protein
MDELEGYLERKMEETRKIEALIRNESGLNHRQTTLLAHALRNPYATYTVKEHSSFHNVVQATARTDLDGLTERGMLVKNKAGRAFRFYLAELDEVQPIQVLVVAQEKPYRHSLSLLSRTLRLAIHLRLRSLSLLWTRPRVPAHPIA